MSVCCFGILLTAKCVACFLNQISYLFSGQLCLHSGRDMFHLICQHQRTAKIATTFSYTLNKSPTSELYSQHTQFTPVLLHKKEEMEVWIEFALRPKKIGFI